MYVFERGVVQWNILLTKPNLETIYNELRATMSRRLISKTDYSRWEKNWNLSSLASGTKDGDYFNFCNALRCELIDIHSNRADSNNMARRRDKGRAGFQCATAIFQWIISLCNVVMYVTRGCERKGRRQWASCKNARIWIGCFVPLYTGRERIDGSDSHYYR